MTSLADPPSVVTTGVAFQQKCDVPSGSVCDYDDYFCDGHYDENPDYFDYDFDSYPDVYSFIEPDDYELYHDLHGPDDCGVYCVSRGDVVRVMLSYPGPGTTSRVLFVRLGRMSRSTVRRPGGPVLRNVTFMRVILPYPGPGPMSRSTVLFVHPGRMIRVAPAVKIVTFIRVLFPYAGPVRIRQSMILLVKSTRGESDQIGGGHSRGHDSYVI